MSRSQSSFSGPGSTVSNSTNATQQQSMMSSSTLGSVTVMPLPASGSLPMHKRDVTTVVNSLRQNIRSNAVVRDHLLVLHARLFESENRIARDGFAKFVSNAVGGIPTLLSSVEYHAADASFLEVALVFLCNVMHFGGRRNLRIVAKVVKKGGGRICLSIINKHAANMRIIHPATMAVIALVSLDPKLHVTARSTGALGTLTSCLRGHKAMSKDGLASVLSCICSLARGKLTLQYLAKRSLVPLLMEICTRNLESRSAAVLIWSCKAMLQLSVNDECAKEIATDGGVTLMLNVLYEHAASMEAQMVSLDVIKQLIRFPDGLVQYQACGGHSYIVSVVIENNLDKETDKLLHALNGLNRFFGIVDLPIEHDNDLTWVPPNAADADIIAAPCSGSSDDDEPAGDGSGVDGDDLASIVPPMDMGPYCPELADGIVGPDTAIPEAVIVHHVKPFTDHRPTPLRSTTLPASALHQASSATGNGGAAAPQQAAAGTTFFDPSAHAGAPVEELLHQSTQTTTDIIRHAFRRLAKPQSAIYQVVYDDLPRNTTLPKTLLNYGEPRSPVVPVPLTPAPPGVPPAQVPNPLISSAAQQNSAIPPLKFASNFECGNLQRAIQMFDNEYDLIIHPDINTGHHCQWFFFSVENMRPDVTYKFNILNMEKPGSTFGSGQRLLMFSERRHSWSGYGWLRNGHHILYHRNSYRRPARRKKGGAAAAANSAAVASAVSGSQHYFTLTFSIRFPFEGDRVFLAPAYPYSFGDLITYLKRISVSRPAVGFKDGAGVFIQSLCLSESGNNVPLVTITSMATADGTPYTHDEILQRPVCVISARVHPGETIASFMAKGLIDYLLQEGHEMAQYLRDNFVWKIVPMLNPDGVINGNHRCCLTGRDLNREFMRPDPARTPTVYAFKELLRHMKHTEGRNIVLYGDFHGHSRRRNFFVYACGQARRPIQNIIVEKVFPRVLGDLVPYFSADGSLYKVQRAKQTTGRVVAYRELGIRMSFTLEGSMMGGDGCDFAPLGWSPLEEDVARRSASTRKTVGHFNPEHYCSIGAMFVKSIGLIHQADVYGQGPAYDAIVDMIHDANCSLRNARGGGGGSAAPNGKKISSSVVVVPCPPSASVAPSEGAASSTGGAGGDAGGAIESIGAGDAPTPTSASMSGSYVTGRRGSMRRANTSELSSSMNGASVTASQVVAISKKSKNGPVVPALPSASDVAQVLKALLHHTAQGGLAGFAGGGRSANGGGASTADGDDDAEDPDEDDDVYGDELLEEEGGTAGQLGGDDEGGILGGLEDEGTADDADDM